MKTVLLFFIAMVAVGRMAAADPSDFLQASGFDAGRYDVMLSWDERAPQSPGELVYGFHLAPLDGSAAFDVYFDQAGVLLDAADLLALGVGEKDWSGKAVSKATEIAPALEKALPETPIPMEPGAPLELTLPALDEAKLLIEDEVAKGAERIGALRDLDLPITVTESAVSDGAWRETPDGGRIWSLCIRSTGAYGQRIHFTEMTVPSGVRLIVYNNEDTTEAYGPFSSGEDFWTPTCFGEGVTVECYAAPDASRAGLSLEIDRIVHNYKDLLSVVKAAGACNNDVGCFDAWTTASHAVGGIGTIGENGTIWCTGALVADNDATTVTPYFLTAHHCVGSVSAASTIEVYWLYQHSTCGGGTPTITTVPRTTGGADYLAGTNYQTGSDFTFLRLKNDPPSGLAYLGYETASPSVGDTVVVIHHPDGDYKRISFGTKIDTGSPTNGNSPLEPYARFHEILWNDGTTEPGSSGSPLLLESTGQIIGQLYGGYAACSYPNEPDYFGRFDVSYTLIESWLNQGPSIYDVDASGTVNTADVQQVLDAALRRTATVNEDFDSSGSVDAKDLEMIIKSILN